LLIANNIFMEVFMKKAFGFVVAALILGAGFFACVNPVIDPVVNGPGNDFVAVTGITGIEGSAVKNTAINLGAAAVEPSTATNKVIVWSVKNAGTTGLTAGEITSSTITPTAAGTLKLTATIADGLAAGTPYKQDFTVTVTNTFVAVTDITGVPTEGTQETALDLSGVTVTPADATKKIIVWSVAADSGINAANVTIAGQTVTPQTAGTLKLTATIAGGGTDSANYTKTFTVTVTSNFVAVTDITNVPETAYMNVETVLNSAKVNPDNAADKTIVWTVKTAGGTGVTNDDLADQKFTPTAAGTLVLTATIAKGKAEGTEAFTADFTITVSAVDDRQPLAGTVSISGNAEAGATLSAENAANTLTNEVGVPSYVWQWGESASGPWDPIAEATGETYILVDADVGKYVRVIVSYSGNKDSVASGASAQVTWDQLGGTVTITGATDVGQTLTADTSGITKYPSGTLSYQWQRGDSPAFDGTPANIGGNSDAYTLVETDQGKYVRVVVSCDKNTGNVTSGASDRVTWPAISGKPAIGGTPKAEETLTANTDALSGLGSGTTSYQWKWSDTSDGSFSNIDGATEQTYLVTAGDAGKYLKVEVGNTKNRDTVLSDAVQIAALYTGDRLTSIEDVTTYLAAASGGATPGDPVRLPPIEFNLEDATNGWAALLTAVKAADKFVALDLSACTVAANTDGVMMFDPKVAVETGKNKIVSLVLPDMAERITPGGMSSPFKNFSALTSVSGSGITLVCDFAFYFCTTLTTADFPKAETIANFVFAYTGGTPLAITLGSVAPTALGTGIFDYITVSKAVTLRVPSGATGYGEAWQTKFKGGNSYITLKIEEF
jgi:hypothetical protein